MFRLVILTVFLACIASQNLPRLDGRIIGGKDTNIEAHPYQVSIRLNGKHICGGAILSENEVVTTANCVMGRYPSAFTVVAGTSFLTSEGEVKNLFRISYLGSFDKETLINDIATLQLASNFTFSSKIKPIRLATTTPPAGLVVQVTGWGETQSGGDFSEVLQVVTLNVVSNEKCDQTYGSNRIAAGMICAGGNGKDACEGDIGGPLIAGEQLFGIASWGYGCSQPNVPTVYTNVASFKTFLNRN